MREDPVYMDKLALLFLRAWPDVPQSLRPVYARFYDTGLIWADPNVDPDPFATDPWPGGLRLTERGERLKEIVDGQSYNFFTVEQVRGLIKQGDPGRIFKDTIKGAGYLEPPPAGSGLLHAMAGLEIAMERLAEAFKNRAKVRR